MSVYEERVLTCPHCGHGEPRSVAVSLDGARAAQQWQEIQDDTFQRFTCTACGKVFRADGPLIYIDFDAKLWIGVFPAPWETAWWDHEDVPRGVFDRYMTENCPPLVREWAPGFAVRAVFGLDRLREKLVAHEAGIDDRVLEVYKLELLRGMGLYELSPRARPILREATATSALFHVPRPDPGEPGNLAKVRVARAEIDRIAAAQDGEWASAIAAVAEGPYVDLGRLFAPRPAGEATA
jgi:predicted nucleic-acid-binding Zn-ribbon protein